MKLLLVLLAIATPAAADRYVSPTGSDAGPGTEAQPWSTIAKANTSAAAGEIVHVAGGAYAHFPNPAQQGVRFIGGPGVSAPGGQLNRPNVSIEDFTFRGSVSVWGNGCRLARCSARASFFGLDNWAGVDDVAIEDCEFDLRAPGSSNFLVRIQPEADARIRRLRMARNRIVMTTLPGQPVDQKIAMLNRLNDCRFELNLWLFRDSTGQDVGSSVRQGFLVRDAIAGNTWTGDTIRAQALLGGRGNVGIDFTSSGNTIAGGGNTWRGLVVENQTSGYTQFQWKMQPGDRMESCRITSRSPFRISGAIGETYFGRNRVSCTGAGVALILGGSANWSGHLRSEWNQFSSAGAARSGVSYEATNLGVIDSDWNWFVNTTQGQEVMIGNVRQALSSACARGWECGSTPIRTKGPIQ